MATQTTPNSNSNPNESLEEIVFYSNYSIELIRKKGSSDKYDENFLISEVRINGKSYRLRYNLYTNLLNDLKKKIEILEIVNNETYQALKKEIILDLVHILYKLEIGERK